MERLKLYKYYKNILNKNSLKKKLFNKKELLGEGGQGKVYRYTSRENECLAVKKSYLDKKQSKYIDDIFNIKSFKYGVFIELSSYYFINQLVLQSISPNFILNYDYEFIQRTGICNDIYPYTSHFYNEYIPNSQTYTEWVAEDHPLQTWYNAYFQITTAIYVLQKYFNMTHLDLHSDNILVQKVKRGGYWNYIINGNTYKVPNMGYVFYINDFGHAFIPKIFTSWFTKRFKNIHKGFDIYQLFKSTLKISKSPKEFKMDIKYIIKQLKNNVEFHSIIENIWGEKYIKNNVKKSLQTLIYNLDKHMSTTQIPIQLKHLVQTKTI